MATKKKQESYQVKGEELRKDKEAWESIFATGEKTAKRLKIKNEAQINRMIADYRRGKRKP